MVPTIPVSISFDEKNPLSWWIMLTWSAANNLGRMYNSHCQNDDNITMKLLAEWRQHEWRICQRLVMLGVPNIISRLDWQMIPYMDIVLPDLVRSALIASKHFRSHCFCWWYWLIDWLKSFILVISDQVHRAYIQWKNNRIMQNKKHITQREKLLGTKSIRHRPNTFTSDRCVIDTDPGDPMVSGWTMDVMCVA